MKWTHVSTIDNRNNQKHILNVSLRFKVSIVIEMSVAVVCNVYSYIETMRIPIIRNIQTAAKAATILNTE